MNASQLDSMRNEEQHITRRRQVVVRAISDAQQEIERLKSTLSEAERLRRTLSDWLNMLKNWRSSLSGYSDGVRALLRAPIEKVSGIIGPVPQLGIAPSGLEFALEAALGPYLQGVVVQTFEDAQTSVDYLSASKAGKAMVIWLDKGDSQREMMTTCAEIKLLLKRNLSTSYSLKCLPCKNIYRV